MTEDAEMVELPGTINIIAKQLEELNQNTTAHGASIQIRPDYPHSSVNNPQAPPRHPPHLSLSEHTRTKIISTSSRQLYMATTATRGSLEELSLERPAVVI